MGSMPSSTIGIGLGIDGRRKRSVNRSPVRGGGGTVDGRSDQRMPKPDPRGDLEQLLGRRWLQRLPLEPERLGRPPDQGCVPNRVRRRQEHQSSGRVGQRSDAPAVLVLDPIHDISGVG